MDERAFGALEAKVDVMAGQVSEIHTSLKSIMTFQQEEIAGCPFQPKRGANGDLLISRVAAVEKTIAMNKAYLRGLLLGVAVLGLIQLGPSGWSLVLRFLMGV